MATTPAPSPGILSSLSPALWERPPLAVCIAALVAWAVAPALPYLDDSYIVLHAAQVIRTGQDTAYGASPLVGITSPAYLALVVVIEACGLAGQGALQVAGALGLFTWLVGAWTLTGVAAVRGSMRLVLPAVTLLSGHVLLTATNGLETGWATALVTWALVFALRKQPYRAATVCGLALAMRPDLAPVAVALCVMVATPTARGAVLALAVAGLVLTPFLLWLRLDTGAWWPQTLAAKRVFFAEGCQPALEKMRWAGSLLAAWGGSTAPVAVGLAAALWTRAGRVGLAACALVLGAYVWNLPGGIAHNEYRYLTPLLVPWGGLGLAVVASRVSRRLAAAAVVALAIVAVATRPPTDVQRGFARDMVDAARWIDAETPADATILVHDAGALAVLTRRRLVDVIGLKTPASRAVHAAVTWPSCGRQRPAAIDAIAGTADASYLAVVDDWEGYFAIARGLSDRGWRLTPLRAHVPGTRGYDIYRIQRAADASAPAGSAAARRRTPDGQAMSPRMATSATPETVALQTTAAGR